MSSKSHRNLWIAAGALCLALAALLALLSMQRQKERERRRQRDERLQALAAAVLSGDDAAIHELKSEGVLAVTLVENFIEQNHRVEARAIEASLADLSNPDPRRRRIALAKLTLLPERAGGLLRSHYEQTRDPGLREQLKPLVLDRAKTQQRVAGIFTALYSEHRERLFAERAARLQKDVRDGGAQLFFAYAPFQEIWPLLPTNAPDTQLRFLLLRAFTGRDEAALEHLESFPAREILRGAAQTWWPVEIEAPQKDGAYTWTTRAAAVNGNVATHLLRLSIRDPSRKSGGEAEWLHFDRWLRWTYIFKYARPILGKDAVVFAEGIVREANQGGRGATRSRTSTKKAEKFWLPETSELEIIGDGRCETVRGVPKTARLPVAALSKEESIGWHGGAAFEWSRPFFPETIRDRVRFGANKFPVPEITPAP